MMDNNSKRSVRFLTFPELRSRGVPFCRDYVRMLVREGKFPRPVQISAKRIGWIEAEITAWAEARVAERDAA